MTKATAALIEDAEFLIASGTGSTEILRRLGTNAEALSRRMQRAGRRDLASHFERQRTRTTRPCIDCGRPHPNDPRKPRCFPCSMVTRNTWRGGSRRKVAA